MFRRPQQIGHEAKEERPSVAVCNNSAGKCLARLYLSEHLSDVIFVCKDKVRLPVHKLILSMRSDVFEAMFYGTLAENEGTINIEDIDSKCMKELLQFVYTDKSNISGENVLGVLYGAKKYGLEDLIQLCSNFLETSIDVNAVCTVHQQASLYDMEALQSRCFQYMLQHATGVFETNSFLQIKPEVLIDFLKHEKLGAQEINVFKAALKWSHQRCKETGIQVTGDNMRDSLGEALYQIRFPVLSMKVFANEVSPTGILTKDEQIELYQYFATDDAEKVVHFITKARENVLVPEMRNIIPAQPMTFEEKRSIHDRYSCSSERGAGSRTWGRQGGCKGGMFPP